MAGEASLLSTIFNKDTLGALGGIGQLASGVGQAWSAYKTNKYNKQIADQNKEYFKWSLDRAKKNDENFNNGFRLDW